MKIKRLMIAVLCLGLCVAFSTACNHENMSRVTLYLGVNDQAINVPQKSFLNNLMAFLLPSANAKTVNPPAWTETYINVSLTVTGEDMDSITAVIPPSAVSYTLEVPAGKSRLFVLIATNGSNVRTWGGRVASDLNPGDVSLTLRILPIPNGWDYQIASTENIIGWSPVAKPFVTSYNLYRSSSAAGPYTIIYTGPDPGTMGYHDTGIPINSTFYYKASINTTYGEGELSDYLMVYNNW